MRAFPGARGRGADVGADREVPVAIRRVRAAVVVLEPARADAHRLRPHVDAVPEVRQAARAVRGWWASRAGLARQREVQARERRRERRAPRVAPDWNADDWNARRGSETRVSAVALRARAAFAVRGARSRGHRVERSGGVHAPAGRARVHHAARHQRRVARGAHQWAVATAAARGWRCVALNLRGCGGTALASPKVYCAASSSDVRGPWTRCHAMYPAARILLSAYSLGTYIVGTYLAEEDCKPGGRGAAAPPAPC